MIKFHPFKLLNTFEKNIPSTMKKLTLLLSIGLFTTTAFAQVNVKQVDQNLVKINDKIYASKFETSNGDYMQFIEKLKAENNETFIQIAQVQSANWNSEPMANHYHSHEAYKDYPVVNVSLEAVSLYCRWLTKEYNNSTDRQFKKVIFRLPTVNEWETAAKAGNVNATYAFKGNSLKNNKGEILANFKNTTNESSQTPDLTAPVNSYFPNGFGIFNMSGNVSEMVIDSPVTKGGSWNGSAEFLTITSNQNFDKVPSPSVGFRVFMEVIEK